MLCIKWNESVPNGTNTPETVYIESGHHIERYGDDRRAPYSFIFVIYTLLYRIILNSLYG